MDNSLFGMERIRIGDTAALLDYLKIVGGETENISFGLEEVPIDISQGGGMLVILKKHVPEFKAFLVSDYEDKDDGEIMQFIKRYA